jgi:hypothetical protein
MWIEKSLVFLQEKNIDWFLIWSDWNIAFYKSLKIFYTCYFLVFSYTFYSEKNYKKNYEK